MKIQLEDIQPSEEWLIEESVRYYKENQHELEKALCSVKILLCQEQPFKYIADDGNNRLYVAYEQGEVEIEVSKLHPAGQFEVQFAQEVYDKRIRNWGDLKGRVISQEERTQKYNALYGTREDDKVHQLLKKAGENKL